MPVCLWVCGAEFLLGRFSGLGYKSPNIQFNETTDGMWLSSLCICEMTELKCYIFSVILIQHTLPIQTPSRFFQKSKEGVFLNKTYVLGIINICTERKHKRGLYILTKFFCSVTLKRGKCNESPAYQKKRVKTGYESKLIIGW